MSQQDELKPYIPPEQDLPQITIKAVVLGIILSAVLAGANAYLGLKVGMTVSASIPAAVISMAVLKLFKRSNILENNIVQTAASAGESLAAGAIFTLPALILLHYWVGFPYLQAMLITLVGGILGVLFTIPLRRALIIESKLQFPEGIATGEVLKEGTEGGQGIKLIALSAVCGALFKLGQTGFKIFSGSVGHATTVGKSIFGYGIDMSVALLGVGYIVGLNIAVLMFAGGAISWLVGIPIYSGLVHPQELQSVVGDATGYDAAYEIWSAKIRYLGVGAMIVGGVWAIFSLAKPMLAGIKSSLQAMRAVRSGQGSMVLRTERDIPIHYLGIGVLLSAIPIFLVMDFVVDISHLGVSSELYWTTIGLATLFALIAGFLFSSVASYMAGLVGSSNNPISGVTISTILTVSLLLYWLLRAEIDFSIDMEHGTAAAVAAILVGSVVCCAAAIGGDNLQDLKTGQIVGATPYKQQIMQIVGVVAGALAIPWVLQLLFDAYGLGGVFPRENMNASEMLAAPQATLMQSVAQGVFAGKLEWTMIGIGGAIAVFIIVTDQILKAKQSSFRMPVLAVAVGIYLPFELEIAILVGGLISFAAARRAHKVAQRTGEDSKLLAASSEKKGVLFASGLITGESLIGVLLAIPFAYYQNTNVLRLVPAEFVPTANLLGLTIMLCFMLWLYRITSVEKPRELR